MEKITVEGRPKHQHRRRKHIAPLGFLILVLALIGCIALISFIIGQIKSITDDTNVRKEYDSYIAPVVMLDLPPFYDITKVDNDKLKLACIYALTLNHSTDKYTVDEQTGFTYYPATDIENMFYNLFGDKVKPVFKNFKNGDVTYEYHKDKDSYLVPPSGTPAITPHTRKIIKSRNKVELIVDYYDDPYYTDTDGTTVALEPYKTMKYIIQTEKKQKRIVSIDNYKEAAKKSSDIKPSTTSEIIIIPSQLPEVSSDIDSDKAAASEQTSSGEAASK